MVETTFVAIVGGRDGAVTEVKAGLGVGLSPVALTWEDRVTTCDNDFSTTGSLGSGRSPIFLSNSCSLSDKLLAGSNFFYNKAPNSSLGRLKINLRVIDYEFKVYKER